MLTLSHTPLFSKDGDEKMRESRLKLFGYVQRRVSNELVRKSELIQAGTKPRLLLVVYDNSSLQLEKYIGFQDREVRDKRKKIQKNLNTHPYSIKKLSTKKNTQKSLFLNILRCNHLPIKTKDKILLFFYIFF